MLKSVAWNPKVKFWFDFDFLDWLELVLGYRDFYNVILVFLNENKFKFKF
jgi:hypothetical protein